MIALSLRLAGQFGIRGALADDLANEIAKPLCIVHRPSIVEAKRLLIDVAEQMERFDADVRALQLALQ